MDDGHLTVTVPAGSGTVDVRVQSGVSHPNDSENINSPVFGYGISATSSADRFSYGGSSSNQPPTVAIAAAASPSLVTGTTTALSVLGADDGGEANLTYSWEMTGGPSGAKPAFSVNGTNAAKNSTVTFNRAGSYVFQVTITDAGGLSVASSTSVSVQQTATTLQVSPSSTTVSPGAQVHFSATVLDQFAVALTKQPTLTWKIVSGPGTISSTGVYTAPKSGTGTTTVQVSADGLLAKATIQVRSSSKRTASVYDYLGSWFQLG